MTRSGMDDRGALIAGLARLATDLATGAGDLVRAHAGAPQTVRSKSTATDLVTDVDRLAEAWLRERLALLRPGDAILGEEGGGSADDAAGRGVATAGEPARGAATDVRWVLDPIDGTVNFVLGLPQFAVSIAVELAGDVVAAAVCNPMTGELFHARVGGGAYVNDQPLSGPRDVGVERMVVGTGFGYDAQRRVRQVAVVSRLLPRIADIRRLGAASLDLCAVAAGRLDGFFEVGLQRWDYAAGALVATEAGCAVRGPAGGAPSSELVVATGRAVSAEFAGLLKECGIDAVLAP